MLRLRPRFALMLGISLTILPGCFGTPFDKGDGSGTGTGRPDKSAVDAGRTGGLGSPRGNQTIGPGELGTEPGSAPGVGPK